MPNENDALRPAEPGEERSAPSAGTDEISERLREIAGHLAVIATFAARCMPLTVGEENVGWSNRKAFYGQEVFGDSGLASWKELSIMEKRYWLEHPPVPADASPVAQSDSPEAKK